LKDCELWPCFHAQHIIIGLLLSRRLRLDLREQLLRREKPDQEHVQKKSSNHMA
jgi:hypothetical protein